MICAIRNLTVGVFEHLETISTMYVDKIIYYTQRILMGTVLNKYWQILVSCKDSAKGVYGDQWALGPTNNVTMENLWTWEKTDANDGSEDMYLERNLFVEF